MKDEYMKIMIVEDDCSIAEELKGLLLHNGYEVLILRDFKNSLNEIVTNNPDLVLLDINIPDINGEVLLKNLREVSSIPVIMVTSSNSEIDEALSISYGADDFITKPYNPTILLLRISAVLRRTLSSSHILKYGDLIINIHKGTIRHHDEEMILTKNEMIILTSLINHANRIVTRDELMTELWNSEEYINDNALTVNISRLRSKLKDFGYEDLITTRKGQGYILS